MTVTWAGSNLVQFNLNQLQELLAAVNQTDINELILKADDFELTVRRGFSSGATTPLSPNPGSVELVSPGAQPTQTDTASATSIAPQATVSSVPPSTKKENWLEITSPMVGTFYRAPAPDEPPFIAVGDRVKTGQTVCIIEAMKLMNELESEVSGTVSEILVENGQPIEFNQTLIRIIPD